MIKKVAKVILSKQFLVSATFLMMFGFVSIMPELNRRAAVNEIHNSIHEAVEAVQHPVDFTITQIKSYAHNIGHKEIKQEGAAGVREVKYSVKVRGDGLETARDQISDAIVLEPTSQVEIVGARLNNALTKSKGAHVFVDSKGVSHRETYYDLPMNVVIGACGGGGYKVREDGAKVDKDGYVIVAANYANYPRCSIVETSMGPGKVYDTGGFAKKHPHGFDLATDWTKGDGI